MQWLSSLLTAPSAWVSCEAWSACSERNSTAAHEPRRPKVLRTSILARTSLLPWPLILSLPFVKLQLIQSQRFNRNNFKLLLNPDYVRHRTQTLWCSLVIRTTEVSIIKYLARTISVYYFPSLYSRKLVFFYVYLLYYFQHCWNEKPF